MTVPSPLHRCWPLLALVSLAIAPTLTARSEPPDAEDAAAEPAPPEPGEPPAPREVDCIDDPSGVRLDVELAFAELQRIHRTRVPGPSGLRVLEAHVNELLERLVGFDEFVDLALGEAWDAAPPEQKRDWRVILKETLRRRYLKKLGSPLSARIEITRVVPRCDKAEVALVVSDRQGQRPRDVILQLVASAGPDERTVWHVYDVSVDDVSLLETWRSRFRRIYADGGVAAIEHHMRGLRDRNVSGPR